MPRSNNIDHSWYNYMTGDLMKVIQYFISLNEENIDTSRIYIFGLSAGAGMVYYMLTAYPNYFAAAIPMSSLVQPSQSDMDSWKDTSLRIYCSDIDLYTTAATSSAKPTFNYFAGIQTNKDKVRISTYSKTVRPSGVAVDAAFNPRHNVWNAVFYDMHMNDGSSYAFCTTKNGYGTDITFDDPDIGLIDWLYQQSRPEESDTNDKSTSTFISILRMIINFFKKLSGIA